MTILRSPTPTGSTVSCFANSCLAGSWATSSGVVLSALRNVGLALFALAVLPMLAACAQEEGAPSAMTSPLTIVTGSGEHSFIVEVADTDEVRRQGLMFREEMAADAGMLFVFEQAQVITMWMRNTPLPLDMIFLSSEGRVVHIAENTVPFSDAVISSRFATSFVLEVNAGVSARIGLKAGDRVLHPAFSTVADQ